MNAVRLTPEQKRIMLVLCNAAEKGRSVKLVWTPNTAKTVIREPTTGEALVRKGLAVKNVEDRYTATDEGYWLGDALRIEDRLGKIPARLKR